MARAKKKKSATEKQPQTKIPGTGRLDANEKIEAQAEVVRLKCAKRMAIEVEERGERDKLTEMMKAEGFKPGEAYTYEDGDGEMRDAFIPEVDDSPRAKVRKHRTSHESDE